MLFMTRAHDEQSINFILNFFFFCFFLGFLNWKDGKGQDRDKEDREQHESTGDLLQAQEWAAEESI